MVNRKKILWAAWFSITHAPLPGLPILPIHPLVFRRGNVFISYLPLLNKVAELHPNRAFNQFVTAAVPFVTNVVKSALLQTTTWNPSIKWTPSRIAQQRTSYIRQATSGFPKVPIPKAVTGFSSLPILGSLNRVLKTKMSRRRKRTFSSFRRTKRFKSAGVKALKAVRKLEKQREVKISHVGSSVNAIDTSGTMVDLSLIPQGDDSFERDGLAIAPFRFDIRAQWRGDAAATVEIYRTIIFQDRRQVSGATPLVLDVLRDAHPLSVFAIANRTRWKVLYDETFSGPSDTASRLSFVFIASMKMSMTMTWSGVAANTIKKNGLYMLLISNVAPAGNNPDYQFFGRILYNDG